ncbi:MAG: DNA ligase [Deltaproteobacteria bacterium]|nr:MAG: DNA ligase [Deltaproteobacteria bacterium]
MKYPRTYHLVGSLGQDKPDRVAWSELPGEYVVIEEKLDGTQVSLRMEGPGQLIFQSRGTVLSGGPHETEFARLKAWAYAHVESLWSCLQSRYILFGEWLYAKHTVFYDALPHYFFAFDIWDQHDSVWLSTPKRRELLAGTPVVSVPVLFEGSKEDAPKLESLLQPSLYKTETWKDSLREIAQQTSYPWERLLQETEDSLYPEGLYIKAETTEETVGWYKYIRPDFLHRILESEGHWRQRTLLPNQLQPGVTL